MVGVPAAGIYRVLDARFDVPAGDGLLADGLRASDRRFVMFGDKLLGRMSRSCDPLGPAATDG